MCILGAPQFQRGLKISAPISQERCFVLQNYGLFEQQATHVAERSFSICTAETGPPGRKDI